MKPLLTLPFLLLSTPALAFEHAETGFGLNLSDDFIIDDAIPQQPDYSILVGVRSATGEPAPAANEDNLCMVGFTATDANAGMTQKEINAFTNTEEWGSTIRASLSSVMTVDTMESARLDRIQGMEIVARPNIGPDADTIRLVLTLFEMPAGRVSVSCVATATTLDAMLPTFRAIRDGITAPR